MAISLSAGVRQSLQSLTSTAALAQTAQERLATGKRVNSAIDNPVNFFTAANLNSRAAAFSELLDGLSNSIQTVKAASTGISGITTLVKQLQSTVKQAQSDAVANRPTKTGAAALATAAESAATRKSLAETVLSKSVVDNNGATANTATSTYAGNLGVAATNTNLAVTLTAGNRSYTANLAATSTVRDLVNEINKSGIATASVDATGKFSITGAGSNTLRVGVGAGTSAAAAVTDAAAGGQNTVFGLIAADATTGIASSGSSSVRAGLVSQFNDLRDQVDGLAKDAGFNGINLLAGDQLKTTFNEKTGADQNTLTVQGSTITSTNVGIGVAGTDIDFQDDTALATAADALTGVLSTFSSLSSRLGASLSVMQARQDFSKSLIDTLKIGADNLVNADTNEEGANLLALQTRQQLSQTALTLSSQADQAVLRLF